MRNLYQRYIEEDGTQPVPDDHTTNSDILQKVMRKQIGGYLVTLVLTFFTVGIFAVLAGTGCVLAGSSLLRRTRRHSD